MRRALLVLVAAALLAAAAPASAQVPHIKHYFVIVLENKNFEETFGEDSKAPYLAKTLRARGAFLSQYYAIGHLSLDNYIAMVSGQAPNPQTQADCLFFTDFLPGTPAADGQVTGSGCVYPTPTVQTVANQLEGDGYSWKGYMEDMAAGVAAGDPATWSRPCPRVRMAWWRRLTGRKTQRPRTRWRGSSPAQPGTESSGPVRARGFGRPRRRPPELCEEH